ncbi:hypothetical protein CRUP_000710, partial [Coryphaenoides rupestris]
AVLIVVVLVLQDQAISARELQQMLNGVLSRREAMLHSATGSFSSSHSAYSLI